MLVVAIVLVWLAVLWGANRAVLSWLRGEASSPTRIRAFVGFFVRSEAEVVGDGLVLYSGGKGEGEPLRGVTVGGNDDLLSGGSTVLTLEDDTGKKRYVRVDRQALDQAHLGSRRRDDT